MDQSIAVYIVSCLGLFEKTLEVSEAEGPNALLSFNEGLKDEETRFKVWSGSIGAQGTGVRSLDYRLRESSKIWYQLVSLLQDLTELLQDALAIITEDKIPWDQLGHDEGVIPSGGPEELGLSVTEIGQISTDVADVVNCLLRLGVPIRDPAPINLFIGSNSMDTSHYEEFDIQHVRFKFVSVSSILAQRLGKAISRRRRFLRYRLEQQNRLLDDSQTFQLYINGDDCSDTEYSQTSYATSLPDVDQCRVPPLPDEASKGPFECTFCCAMINVSGRPAWKKHVYRDLQPCICLHQDCITPEKQFSRRRQWMAHMKQDHWKVYSCPFHCNLTLPSMSECEEHVTQHHTTSGVTKELSTMIRLNEKALDLSQGLTCPLCDIRIDSAQQYQRHVGRHQEELALFALSGLESTNESDPDDEENSGVEFIASDYDESSDDDDIFENSPIHSPPGTRYDINPAYMAGIAEETGHSSRRDGRRVTGTGRQNAYFLPGDGIDREVISTDICSYLGSDALARPGHRNDPETGQAMLGYYITAYTNLTRGMINDLKADSARWDSERRLQRGNDRHDATAHRSHYYQHSIEDGIYAYAPDLANTFEDRPRYPGRSAAGYTGASGSSIPLHGGSSRVFGDYNQAHLSVDSGYNSVPWSIPIASQSRYAEVGTNRRPRGYDAYVNETAAQEPAPPDNQTMQPPE